MNGVNTYIFLVQRVTPYTLGTEAGQRAVRRRRVRWGKRTRWVSDVYNTYTFYQEAGKEQTMANNVIGLFENKSVADQVVEELKNNGFKERNINRFEGDQSDIEGELEREGVADADANYYAEGLRQGGALVSVRVEDSHVDEAVEIMNRYAGTEDNDADYAADEVDYAADTEPVDADIVGADSLETTTDDVTDSDRGTVNTGDETRLDVVEERLRVGKRDVERGGMRVRRVVTERPVEEQVTLRDETIRVDRQTVDRKLDSADNTDGDLFTEKTYEFTETDEEAVIAKEAHVVEEVVVGKDVEERTETVRGTVRRADVEIEELAQGLASDARYENREWHEFEDEARTEYERGNSGGNWDEVKDDVRTTWEEKRRR